MRSGLRGRELTAIYFEINNPNESAHTIPEAAPPQPCGLDVETESNKYESSSDYGLDDFVFTAAAGRRAAQYRFHHGGRSWVWGLGVLWSD